MYSTKQLVERWEDQREIKNLMGKYANCIILNRENEVFDRFWSKDTEDLSLAFNDGCYRGLDAVFGYYDAVYRRNCLVASTLRDNFPEQLGGQSDEEIYGIGPFKVKPMYCPVIEIAEDGETAKGLWYCQGAYNEVGTSGPVAYWTWGYFAVDFVRQDGNWRIFHLMHVNDVDCVCGQSWGREPIPYPELPEFAALKNFAYPPYTEEKTVYSPYNPKRPLVSIPKLPEPYTTFVNTHSYAL